MVSQSDSVEFTIMGKTADLTGVQKTIIDTLHKEGKPLKVIAKEVGCSQSTLTRSGLRLELVHQEPPHTDGSWTWASNVVFLLSSRS